VFLHGWPDSWFSFSRVLPLLPERLHVFVPDQRGFGDSEKPDAGYRIEDFAADAAAFLDAVSVKRATVVGHSFGSFVTRHLALVRPERVARIVLIGTAVSAATPVVARAKEALGGLPGIVPVEFARHFQESTIFRPLPVPFFERLVTESMKLPGRLWREVLDGIVAYDDWKQLSQMNTPTLLLWGEHDALFPKEDQVRLLDAIHGARLEIYPETGHCPNWEQPERVASDLLAFIT
jgi:pimeloyl-ACP methyl ester carboxylesterase